MSDTNVLELCCYSAVCKYNIMCFDDSAMQVGGGTDDDGNEVPATARDYILHFLTFFWKLVGACVPPT